MAPPRLQLEQTAVLVVDLQEKLLPHMHNAEALTDRAGVLIDGAKVLGVPVLVTEQYPKGLGRTVPPIAQRLSEITAHEKLKFSACVQPVREELVWHGARAVIVCGIEAHVCVLQTCLDLVGEGFIVALALDAIGSRRARDQEAAVMRLVQAGVVPTSVESALLELAHEAGTRFKAILPLIK